MFSFELATFVCRFPMNDNFIHGSGVTSCDHLRNPRNPRLTRCDGQIADSPRRRPPLQRECLGGVDGFVDQAEQSFDIERLG
jgi:hypothetical protein